MKRGPTVPLAVRRGLVGSQQAPRGRRGAPYGFVHQLCTNTGQSSDPSSPIGSCCAKAGFRRKPIGARRNATAFDGWLGWESWNIWEELEELEHMGP